MNENVKKEASLSKQVHVLKNEVSILRTTFIERWNSHDNRSEEKWDALNKELGKIDKGMDKVNAEIFSIKLKLSDKIGSLKCGEHKETMKWHRIFIGGCYASILLLLTAIVNGWIK